MRGMSGSELATRLKESQPRVKVVYISGYTGNLMSAHEPSQPGTPLVEKPFTRASLLRAIQSVA